MPILFQILQHLFWAWTAVSLILVFDMLGLMFKKDIQPIAVTKHPAATQFDNAVADSKHNDINTLAPPLSTSLICHEPLYQVS